MKRTFGVHHPKCGAVALNGITAALQEAPDAIDGNGATTYRKGTR